MQITLRNQPAFKLSVKTKEIIVDVAIYLFVILFMYTAASKFFTLKSFASTLAKSPLIGNFNLIVAYAIPIIEVLISLFLIVPALRKIGLYASLILMTVFTVYLAYMVFSGDKLPCHCGGVISTMSWNQHIWFNISFMTLAVIGLAAHKK